MTLAWATHVPFVLRMELTISAKVAFQNLRALQSAGLEDRFSFSPSQHARRMRNEANLLSELLHPPTPLRKLLPTSAAVSNDHLQRWCSLVAAVANSTWSQDMHTKRNLALRQSHLQPKQPLKAGQAPSVLPMISLAEANIPGKIPNKRASRTERSGYITFVEFAFSSATQWHVYARIHASMRSAMDYWCLIHKASAEPLQVICSCVNGLSGTCSHSVSVLDAIGSTNLQVLWVKKAIPLTKVLGQMKRVPLLSLISARIPLLNHAPLPVSVLPADAAESCLEKVKEENQSHSPFACPFFDCGAEYQQRAAYKKHLLSHTEAWAKLPPELQHDLENARPWDIPDGQYGLCAYDDWCDKYPVAAARHQ